jgi:hypothetical protein
MIYKYCNPANDIAIFRVGDVLNGLGNTFEVNPKWASTLPSGIFHGILKEDRPPHKFV